MFTIWSGLFRHERYWWTRMSEKSSGRAVFFDCWDTIIQFATQHENWNTIPLERHALNHDEIDWNGVNAFVKRFFDEYYSTNEKYEINDFQIYRLLIRLYGIQLDCSVEDCSSEILDNLSPSPMPRISEFLSLLDRDGIYYAVLSNTCYDEEISFRLVKKQLPNSNFKLFAASDVVGVKKPNPLFFEVGLKMSGKLPENSVYIGDNIFADVYGSNRAHFNNSVWLNTKGKDIDTVFADKNIDFRKLNFDECRSYGEVIDLYKEGKLWKK